MVIKIVKGELEAVSVKEKVGAKQNITLSNNLNKKFPSTREIFKNAEVNNIVNEDDDDDKRKIDYHSKYSNSFSEINKGNVPNELFFFSGGGELRIHALQRVGFFK